MKPDVARTIGHIEPRLPLSSRSPVNEAVAAKLEEVAALLDGQEPNPFRPRAYRNAAAVLRQLDTPVSELLETEGQAALERLHDDLPLETLEDLETAAHDGRLERFAGFGPKRIAGRMYAALLRVLTSRAPDPRWPHGDSPR